MFQREQFLFFSSTAPYTSHIQTARLLEFTQPTEHCPAVSCLFQPTCSSPLCECVIEQDSPLDVSKLKALQ